MTSLIHLENVCLCLDRRQQARVEFAVERFLISSGENVALTGPSGCGKSTLLNIVAGLVQADQGTVNVLGHDLRHLSASGLDDFRGRHCGFVFQSFHLLNAFTVLENVELGLRFGARLRQKERRDRAEALLSRVGLGHRLKVRTNQLSVGERQRVAIARALAGRPELLLTDEPTGSLDPATAAEVFDLLQEVVAETGCTWLMVTHDLALAAKMPRQISCDGLVKSSTSGSIRS